MCPPFLPPIRLTRVLDGLELMSRPRRSRITRTKGVCGVRVGQRVSRLLRNGKRVYNGDMESSVRTITVLTLGLLLTLSSCTATPSDTSTSPPTLVATTTTQATTTSSTTTVPAPTTSPTTTTAPVTTSTSSTTTTPPPTTAPDPAPGPVTNLTVGIGGGSGEVMVEWDRGSESDLDHYNLWYSLAPGGAKALLGAVNHDPSTIGSPAYDAGSGRTAYVDFPRAQAEGTECYQVSAVDTASNEGSRTGELCLPVVPPAAVSGFIVGIGGGSGEVFLKWTRSPEPGIDHYNIWYSELPGSTKSLFDTVAHDPGSLSPPAYSIGTTEIGYIDFPRNLVNETQCYQISTVDIDTDEGPRTPERCLSGL